MRPLSSSSAWLGLFLHPPCRLSCFADPSSSNLQLSTSCALSKDCAKRSLYFFKEKGKRKREREREREGEWAVVCVWFLCDFRWFWVGLLSKGRNTYVSAGLLASSMSLSSNLNRTWVWIGFGWYLSNSGASLIQGTRGSHPPLSLSLSLSVPISL